jgi:hypothetical protein
MTRRVAIWGTGNVGAPAIRAVIGHAGLELAGVVVSSEAKEGRDAGELAGLSAETGVLATRDAAALLATGSIDAVVYAAIIENRFEEALGDILACLKAGASVVTSGLYPLQHEATAPEPLLDLVRQACAESGASLMVSGIDPGWNMDIMPLLASALSSGITELRTQEVMNYRHYDQPDIVRNTVGLGLPMDALPPMLTQEALQTVWAPMVHLLGEALNHPVERVTTLVQRRALERDIEIEGMGLFEKGTMGAFRFEVVGHHAGKPLYVVEHVTRIDNECAPDWPYPDHGEGCHRVVITGNPTVTLSCHSEDRYKPGPGGGGNATAACRLVNAIPFVCDAPAGLVSSITVPLSHGGQQLRV